MKILKLSLCNLAAFSGEHTLDFTAPPLSECGLFAITGPTGAGKSTLLDALCLALFDSTPRLRQMPGASGTMPGDEHVQLSNPRTLMRRGCTYASASVTFVGVDGLRYVASWSVHRARNKPSGRLQHSVQSLHCLDPETRLITDGKADFAKRLPETLGLNFDQFTRAVLLAQAEFSAFLRANDNERGALLEKLTDSDIYSRISRKAYQHHNSIKQRNAALFEQIEHERPCTNDIRQALTQRTQQAESVLSTHTQSLETHRQKRQLLEQQIAAIDTYRTQSMEQKKRLDLWEASADQRDLSAALTRFASIRDAVEHRASLQPRHEQLSVSLHKQDNALNEARTAFEACQRKHEKARQQRETVSQQLAGEAHQFEEARSATQQFQQLTEQLSTQQHALDEVTQRCERERTALLHLKAEHTQAHATRESLTTTLIGVSRRPENRLRVLRRRLVLLDRQAQRWAQFKERAEQLDTLRQKRELCQQHVEQAEKEHIALKTALDKAELTAQTAGQNYTLLRDTLQAFETQTLNVLRGTLSEGDPCPVCGSTQHALDNVPHRLIDAQHQARQQQLAPLQQAHQEALIEVDELRDKSHNVINTLTAARTRLDDATQALSQISASPSSARCTLRCKVLAKQKQYWQSLTDTLDTTLHQRRQLDEQLQQADLAYREHVGALTRDEEQHQHYQEQHLHLTQSLAKTEAHLNVLLGEHASFSAWQNVRENALNSATQHEHLTETQLNDARRKLDQLTTSRQTQHDELVALRAQCDAYNEQISLWSGRQPAPWNTPASLHTLRSITSEEQAALIARVTHDEQALNDARAERDASVRHCHSLLNESQIAELATDSDQLAQRLADQRLSDDAPLEALTQALENARQDYDEARIAVAEDDRRRERYAALNDELKTVEHELERWGKISGLIGSADGARFRRMAQQWHLDQLVQQANHHLQSLARRFRLKRGGTELGLMIVDHDMGDEERSVHSLSGGETFLVSLALALGLATMASDRLVLGTLFIDEGFGSLDAEARAMAMDALEALQSEGRQVGIISHVQELHERIPVQVQVRTGGREGASELSLTHPRAFTSV